MLKQDTKDEYMTKKQGKLYFDRLGLELSREKCRLHGLFQETLTFVLGGFAVFNGLNLYYKTSISEPLDLSLLALGVSLSGGMITAYFSYSAFKEAKKTSKQISNLEKEIKKLEGN